MPYADPEKRRAYARVYYKKKRQENPLPSRRYSAKWRAKNKNKTAAYDREVHRLRREAVDDLRREMGGACVVCGYSRCLAALDFHHTASFKGKKVPASQRGKEAWLQERRDHCILVCANCHRELHWMRRKT